MPSPSDLQKRHPRRLRHLFILCAVLTVFQSARHVRLYLDSRPQKIPQAAQQGVEWLITQQNPDGSWGKEADEKATQTPIVLLALLEAPNGGIRQACERAAGYLMGENAAPRPAALTALNELNLLYPDKNRRRVLAAHPQERQERGLNAQGPSSKEWFSVRTTLIEQQKKDGYWEVYERENMDPVMATALSVRRLSPEM